ncbi:MAG: signal peptidase II [Sphingomonadales bacterium]
MAADFLFRDSLFRGSLFRGGLALAVVILVLDQISKWWILDVYDLPARGVVAVLPFLNFVMVWNPGVSFGLFPAESDGTRWFLVALTAAIAVAVVVWMRRADTRLSATALALVLGGAVGNIIDRVLYGAVADFIQLHALGYAFYVFNIADAAISIGVALLLLDVILSGRDHIASPGGKHRRQDG